jgi:hypothetical protein
MSIHKSQGQSELRGTHEAYMVLTYSALDRVKVDLGKVFEKGQGEVFRSAADAKLIAQSIRCIVPGNILRRSSSDRIHC